MTCKSVLPFGGSSFHFPESVLWSTKAFPFDEIQTIYFLNCLCVGVIVWKTMPNVRSQDTPRFLRVLALKRYVLALTFRLLIHFELIVICGDRSQSSYDDSAKWILHSTRHIVRSRWLAAGIIIVWFVLRNHQTHNSYWTKCKERSILLFRGHIFFLRKKNVITHTECPTYSPSLASASCF